MKKYIYLLLTSLALLNLIKIEIKDFIFIEKHI